jgi:hypothetical protein
MNCISVAKDVFKEQFSFIGVETFGFASHCEREKS